jgi:hypothetical protein
MTPLCSVGIPPVIRRAGTRLLRRVALWTALFSMAATAAASIHGKGNVSLSLGLSVSQTQYYDRNYNIEIEVADDLQEYYDEELLEEEEEEEAEDYSSVDGSLFLSAGYFVVDGLEVGLTGSTMVTLYHGGSQSDLYIYDTELFFKYYFDNESFFTPYVGLRGGMSWLDIGTYEETSVITGFTSGIEYSSMKPYTVFLEYGSQYTWNEGDLTGTEWRNRIYLGVSWYFKLGEEEDEGE